MKAAYTVPSAATVRGGSQLEPREPGTVIAAPKCCPESVERAKPMPPQPIHSA